MLGGFIVDVDSARKVTERFGALKAVLGAIPAVYANFKVRSLPFTQNYFLMNASAGIHHHRG